MPEPYEELSIQERTRIVVAMTEWARRQRPKRRPLLRYIDGSTLRPQDLLTESAAPFLASVGSINRLGTRRSRHWAHVLNLIAVSMAHGEGLDAILRDFQVDHARHARRDIAGGGTLSA
jgi:hypothetical protein